MGAWTALKQFFDRSEPLRAPMDDPFIQLDLSLARERLRLVDKGAENGRQNLPPTEMIALDNVESEIVNLIQEHYSRAQIDATNSIRTYDGRLNGLALLSKLSSIDAEAKRAIGDFKKEVSNRRNQLTTSRDAIESSYAELREFRAAHRLTRPAYSAPDPIGTYGTIALAWLFETAGNSFLLRLNDDLGFLGGVVAAGVVGAINVFVAAFVGRKVWPLKNLPTLGSRVLAWTGIFAWIAFMLWWNLTAAHYRDAKSLGLPNPEHQALQMMTSGLDSIYSFGLLALGIVFASAAAAAGYKMDDPHPGYGEITRRHNLRCQDYVDEIRDSSEELVEIRDAAIDEATEVRAELERQLAERNQILVHRDACRRRFEQHSVQLQDAANALLQDYRRANLEARTTPAPAHFNTVWQLPPTVLPHAAPSPLNEEDVRSAEANLEEAVLQITNAFDVAIGSFEPLDVLKRRLHDG